MGSRSLAAAGGGGVTVPASCLGEEPAPGCFDLVLAGADVALHELYHTVMIARISGACRRIERPCGCVQWDELDPVSGLWVPRVWPCWRHATSGQVAAVVDGPPGPLTYSCVHGELEGPCRFGCHRPPAGIDAVSSPAG